MAAPLDPVRLWLESGPKQRTTMVHALDLLGCVQTGRTTAEALAATPDAIRAYARFLARAGQPVTLPEPIQTEVVEHQTEGEWMGNGSPYLLFAHDLEPIDRAEVDRLVHRFVVLREELADWVAAQGDAALDAVPAGEKRSARTIALHVVYPPGGYLSAALASAPGFSALAAATERGELPLEVALRQGATLVEERLARVPDDQLNVVRELSSRTYTVRKALRRTLEHEWEHRAELARRPGGPAV